MFAKLKAHAESIDNDIQDLEKKLDVKTKMVFSIVNTGVSDSSVEFMKNLINELEQMNKISSNLVSECKTINFNSRNHVKKYSDDLQVMKDQVNRIEEHLGEFGYKCEITEENGTYSDENTYSSSYNENESD